MRGEWGDFVDVGDASTRRELFSLSGASAADERYNLVRCWRNARTHTAHHPADWSCPTPTMAVRRRFAAEPRSDLR